MIGSVKFVSIPVSDQERALAFYRDTLGFEVVSDAPFSDRVRWLLVRPPGAQTGLVLFPPSDELAIPCPALVFAAEDLRTTYEELSGRGVEFTQLPYEEPYGVFAHFVDPDGNEFVISSRD